MKRALGLAIGTATRGSGRRVIEKGEPHPLVDGLADAALEQAGSRRTSMNLMPNMRPFRLCLDF